jgi:hypothetical protein
MVRFASVAPRRPATALTLRPQVGAYLTAACDESDALFGNLLPGTPKCRREVNPAE